MCPLPPVAAFQSLAGDSSIPDELRKTAAQYSLMQAAVQTAVDNTKESVSLSKPSSGFKDFTCTIYSMNNKYFPEIMAQEGGNVDSSKLNKDAIMDLPGDLIQKNAEIHPTRIFSGDGVDASRQRCYDNFHTVWNFYKTAFGRNSIDGQGLEIRATIHIARGFDNAYWTSAHDSMFFGDGGRFDGRGWLGPTGDVRDAESLTNWLVPYALDVIGHELTHGVVQYTAALGVEQTKAALPPNTNDLIRLLTLIWKGGPLKEAMTLNEHIADCFGIMIKHFSKNQTADQGNWTIGEDWYSPTAMKTRNPQWTESYMRTFKIPENKATQADQGPKHMKDELSPFNYSTDPHERVGIPNHAFYLAALDLQQLDKKPTWENVGKIWYNGLTDPAFKDPKIQTFVGWRNLTTQHAEKLFGAKGKEIMEKSWKAVGL